MLLFIQWAAEVNRIVLIDIISGYNSEFFFFSELKVWLSTQCISRVSIHWSDVTLLRKISLGFHILDKYIGIEIFHEIIAK